MVKKGQKQIITGAARLVSCAVAMAGAFLVMGACVQPGRPTVPPTDTALSGQMAIPETIPLPAASDLPVPGPLPATELASEPVTLTLTASGSGTDGVPSAVDVALQVLGPVELIPGQTTVYTLTLHNQGPDPATGIVLTHMLPVGVIPVWTQPGQPVCRRQEGSVGCDVGDLRVGDAATLTLDVSIVGTETAITATQLAGANLDLSAGTCTIDQDSAEPQVTCHLANLQAGAEAQMRVGVDVADGLAGSLVHTATVTANEADADRSNNRATASMTVGTGKGPGEVSALPPSTDLVVQADGPLSVIAGQPFTYTYTITNRGGLDATGVRFEDAVPPDMELVAYAPGLPRCEQQGDALTCTLHDLDSLETITVTLVITGHGGAPMLMSLDPLMPGWPVCYVIKERTFLHIVHCELGALKSGQAARVRLVLRPVGVQERLTINTVSVTALEADLNSLDNTITTTMAVQASDGNED